MKVISWNVNGIRAVNKKNCNGEQNAADEMNVIEQMTDELNPDVLCLQEIKTDNKGDLECYRSIYSHIAVNSAAKRGYSGTAILSKETPIAAYCDFYHEEHEEEASTYDFSSEGRLLTAEFRKVNVICCYTVNAKNSLERLDDRQIWDEFFKQHIILTEEKTGKPCIVVGDLNVAHKPADLYNHKEDSRTAGLSKEERQGFTDLLEHAELTDAWRYKNPEGNKWSWWSPITRARDRNAGWRIDYTLVSNSLKDVITEVDILNEYYGSDHCPVMVKLDV